MLLACDLAGDIDRGLGVRDAGDGGAVAGGQFVAPALLLGRHPGLGSALGFEAVEEARQRVLGVLGLALGGGALGGVLADQVFGAGSHGKPH